MATQSSGIWKIYYRLPLEERDRYLLRIEGRRAYWTYDATKATEFRRWHVLNPASNHCQRWNDRQDSWRHVSEGGFDRTRYDVAVLADDNTARAYIERHHYSGSYPAAAKRYGLYEGPELVGVAVLSVPVQAKVLTGVFPDLEPYQESLELGRLVLADSVPANAETWFLARCWELAASDGVRGIVSFSDPVARPDTAGNVIFPGHVGIIYQASNAHYLGRGTSRTLQLLPNGQVLNARVIQKIRSGEQGWEYGEQILVGWGARPRLDGQHRAEWLQEALREAGVRQMHHAGNHRYAFRLGAARKRVRVALPAGAYPKSVDVPPAMAA